MGVETQVLPNDFFSCCYSYIESLVCEMQLFPVFVKTGSLGVLALCVGGFLPHR